MINLNHTRTFLAVHDVGGIRPAARALGVSASTVLEHLRLLEEELAAQLLARARGRLELSRQGMQFLPLARSLVMTAARARSLLHEAPLRIATSSNIGTYLLQKPLALFQNRTATPIELWIGTNSDVAQRLERGDADAALMEWWDNRSGFSARTWKREPLVVIVAPQHRWVRRRFVTPEELTSETLLGCEWGTGTGDLAEAASGTSGGSAKHHRRITAVRKLSNGRFVPTENLDCSCGFGCR